MFTIETGKTHIAFTDKVVDGYLVFEHRDGVKCYLAAFLTEEQAQAWVERLNFTRGEEEDAAEWTA